MEFFEKIFDGITELSAKLPAMDVKAIFIIALCAISVIGIIVGLTYLGASTYKMKSASKKVRKYLANVNEVNDDNAEDFTTNCFGKKAPTALSESWVEYMGVRYGFPSEIMSENRVFDKEVKKVSYARANIFIAIALIVNALLAFWGFGCLTGTEIGVIIGIGLLLSAVIYLILVIVARKEFTKSRELFYEMQDDLDAKVDFHVEKSYSTDASPLVEMAAIIDEIVARNTSREVEMPQEEELVEDEFVDGELLEEELGEELEEVAEVEALEEEPAKLVEDEFVEGEILDEESSEELVEETPLEELAEEAPLVEEIVEDTTADVAEEPATEDMAEESLEEIVEEELVEEGEEDDMFGRRKKAKESAQQIPQEERTFLESEIVEDEEREYLESEVFEDEVVTPQEIVEEEENLDEGDEEVKAPKLSKLSGITSFILSKNFSTKQRIQLTGAMAGLCKKYKNDPENFKYAKKSTAKLVASVLIDKIKDRMANK